MPNLTHKLIDSLRPEARLVTFRDAATPGLELYVTPKGVKSFSLRYTLADGTRRRVNLGRWPVLGLAEARAEALAIMAKAAKGEDPAFDRRRAKHEARSRTVRTMSELADALLEASGAAGVRPTTLTYWGWLNRKHVAPRLGGYRVEDVNAAMVRPVLRAIAAEAGPVTANRAHGLVRRMLNFAVEEGRLPNNPLAGMRALFGETSRARVLSDDEIVSFWRACEAARDSRSAGASRALAIALQLCLCTC